MRLGLMLGFSTLMKTKQVGNVKPMSQNTNQYQVRSLTERICTPPAWPSHSDWSVYLFPPGQVPPTSPSTYWALATLRTLVPETPLITSLSQSPDTLSEGSRQNWFGRGRNAWHASADSSETSENGLGLVWGFPNTSGTNGRGRSHGTWEREWSQ